MRQKARRQAHVRIRNGLDVDRRQPTDDEIQDLLEGISRNAVPRFGLVKLSAMRLDAGVEPPAWFERIIRWPKGELIPMVHLAALRRRDAILVQLLRAGAAPFTRLGGDDNGDHDEEETLSRRARTFLAGLRTPHATWLVVVAAHMRLRAVAASQAVCRNDREPAPADVCNRCGQTGHWAKDCERPKNANAPLRQSRTEPDALDVCNGCGGTGHWFRDCPAAACERIEGLQSRCSACGIDEPSRPMTFGACGHVACEPCAWRHLLDRYGRRGDDDAPPGDNDDDGSANDEDGEGESNLIPADAEWMCPGCAALEVFDERDDDDDDLTRLYAAAPETIAAESKRRWLELSPVVKRLRGGGDPKNGKSSKRFVGLGPRACARLRMGTSRPKRTEALIAAAQQGDARRIRAIVAAGCDVNCSDEYGLTPLMWAGWRGEASAACALLRSGADPGRTARGGGGVTASVAASAAGHVRLAATLRVAEDDAGASVASLTVDWDSEKAESESETETSRAVSVKTLVNPSMDHPGANHSFIVDGAVPEHVLTRLERTWEASTREAAAAVGAALSEESDEVVERIRVEPTDDSPEVNAALAEAARAKAIAEATDARSMERKRSDTCATRAHFCDVLGWARAAVLKAARASGMPALGVHPQFRILHYPVPGGVMAPHVDLSKALDRVDSTWSGKGVGGENGENVEVAGSKPALATTHTFLLYLRTCDAGGETALLREVKSAAGAAGAVGAESLAEVKPLRGRLLVFPHECPHAGRPVVDTNKLVLRGELW